MTTQKSQDAWQTVKFGEIARSISKRVDPSVTELDIYVGLEHLEPNNLKIKQHGVPTDVKGQKLLVRKGQIIFGKRRAYQRKVAVADWDCICSAHAMVLEAIPSRIIPNFLPYLMQSNVFMNRAVAISEGSLSPTIKWKTLAAQEFKIPSLIEQEKLLLNLEKLTQVSELYEHAWDALSRLSDCVIKTLISSYSGRKLSVEELIKSGDIVEVQDGNHGNYHPKASEYVDEGIPFIMASDIVNGLVDIENCKKITKERADKLRIGFSMPGDVLLTHKGTVGLVSVTPDIDDYMMLTPQVTYYRVKKRGVLKAKFLEIYFRSNVFQNQLKSLSAQSTRAYIGITAQKKLIIPMLSYEQQEQLIQLWSNFESEKDKLSKSKQDTWTLLHSLINRD